MKTQLSKLLIFSLFVIALGSCKKDAEMPTGEFVNLETYEAKTITAISAVVDAKAKASCTERGVCWGKAPNPTIDDFHVANGSGKGGYACTLTDLEPDQKYYYRAYAQDGGKYVYAQDEKNFTTKNGLVTLTTVAATNIGSTYATLGGVVNDNGMPILERGVCYGLEPGTSIEGLHAASTDSTNTFAVALTGLENETLYYYKAYVKPQLGSIVYGEELTFTTLDGRPVVSTGDIAYITATSAKCWGEVTDEGHAPVLERGFCWSKEENPTLEDLPHIASGSGVGVFDVELTGLELNTTYHVWAYATSVLGTRYGNKMDFTTKDGVAKVTTGSVTNITATSATCSGEVTDDGGFAVTERGICWTISPNPTLEDLPHIASGSGVGVFDVELTGLGLNTTYHVWAYATNALGVRYGEEKTFTTKDGVVKVTTGNVTDITATSATCSGNVTDDGGSAVTERGICWSTSPNPTLENAQYVAAGNGTGEFSAILTGLEEGTTYHVRAYAVNSNGTPFYGTDVSFTTLIPPMTFTVNGVSFTMIPVEGGTFWMGAQSTNPNGQNYDSEAQSWESPVHQVTLSDYYMGETEVTQALWQAVMGSNPSYFSGSNLPVEQVSWNDCQQFVTKLNQLCASQLNGRQFRLPTEAEWEYAARGGKQSRGYKYSGSNTLGNVAWYGDNSGSTTHAVGTKQANELGLYDMSGNVYEWCSDWYGSYGSGAQTDPTGPSSGSYRVYPSGGWYGIATCCRVSFRSYAPPDNAYNGLGFRLSLR